MADQPPDPHQSPLPPEVLSLPYLDDPQHGPLIANTDVARAFKTTPQGLRTWRNRGRFPAYAVKRGNVTLYRRGDVAEAYHQHFPPARQNAPQNALEAVQRDISNFVASETAAGESGSGPGGGPFRLIGREVGEGVREALQPLVAEIQGRDDLLRENEALRLELRRVKEELETLRKASQSRRLSVAERLKGRIDRVQ